MCTARLPFSRTCPTDFCSDVFCRDRICDTLKHCLCSMPAPTVGVFPNYLLYTGRASPLFPPSFSPSFYHVLSCVLLSFTLIYVCFHSIADQYENRWSYWSQISSAESDVNNEFIFCDLYNRVRNYYFLSEWNCIIQTRPLYELYIRKRQFE